MAKNKKCDGHHHHCCQSNVRCLIQLLEALTGGCDHGHDVEGHITLNQGSHEITVTTDAPVEKVFLSVQPIGTPVCVGDIDKVGYSIVDNGFVLYADIKSAVAEICYIVV